MCLVHASLSRHVRVKKQPGWKHLKLPIGTNVHMVQSEEDAGLEPHESTARCFRVGVSKQELLARPSSLVGIDKTTILRDHAGRKYVVWLDVQ